MKERLSCRFRTARLQGGCATRRDVASSNSRCPSDWPTIQMDRLYLTLTSKSTRACDCCSILIGKRTRRAWLYAGSVAKVGLPRGVSAAASAKAKCSGAG